MTKVVKTFEELIEVVLAELPTETLLQLKKMNWHKLSETHFGLGLYLRNEYIYPSSENLWNNHSISVYKYPIRHRDELSTFLIQVLWLRLNNRKKPPLPNRIWEGIWNFVSYTIYVVYVKSKILKESKERPDMERSS